MQLNTLTSKTARRTTVRIGRGGKRGKTSGRGGKGQTARAGARVRPEIRDLIKKLPKRRGYGKNRARTVNAERELVVVVNVRDVERAFSAGDLVTPATLVEKNVVLARSKRIPRVKILGDGELSKKLTVSGCAVSVSARTRIEEAGGSVS